MSSSSWSVLRFDPAVAAGAVRSQDGQVVTFAIEAWVPGDAETTRRIDESDALRPLRFPQLGEPVEVTLGTGRTGVVATSVRRLVPVALPPTFTFLAWAERMSRHLPELGGLSFEAWDELTSQTIDAIDYLNDPEPRPGAQHLAFLMLIRSENSPELVAKHLSWLGDEDGVPVEADGPAVIRRPEAVVQQMADEGLVLQLR